MSFPVATRTLEASSSSTRIVSRRAAHSLEYGNGFDDNNRSDRYNYSSIRQSRYIESGSGRRAERDHCNNNDNYYEGGRGAFAKREGRCENQGHYVVGDDDIKERYDIVDSTASSAGRQQYKHTYGEQQYGSGYRDYYHTNDSGLGQRYSVDPSLSSGGDTYTDYYNQHELGQYQEFHEYHNKTEELYCGNGKSSLDVPSLVRNAVSIATSYDDGDDFIEQFPPNYTRRYEKNTDNDNDDDDDLMNKKLPARTTSIENFHTYSGHEKHFQRGVSYYADNKVPTVGSNYVTDHQERGWCRNHTIEVTPGVHLRLRGADETWNAIVNDYFIPNECISCQFLIFCILDAAYVLCPKCKFITPIFGADDNEKQMDGSGGGVGLGFVMEDLATWQNKICYEQKLASKNQKY